EAGVGEDRVSADSVADVSDADSYRPVIGDDVTRTAGRTADYCIGKTGSHTSLSVANRLTARNVGTDVVTLDLIVITSEPTQVYTNAVIARDQVTRTGLCPADNVAGRCCCNTALNSTASVAQVHRARNVGADAVALDKVA